MNKKLLIIALFLLALSGLLLHYRIHPFVVTDKLNPEIKIFDSTKFLAFIFPLIDVVLVTALFLSRKTAVYGYLFNGIIVIYGTVLMAHYSIAEMFAKSIPLEQMFLKSTFPDIAIAWADFFTGKVLYDMYLKE
ncbi:MAG: hypothetical protein N2257_08730 [Thermodesulfovibrionales bacterium]|nr:hypothetical protein [Thermodesulfovibrionales bacterium]